MASQVLAETVAGQERRCRLAFLTPAAGSARYLLLLGNELASAPEYPSSLRVEGEGLGLTVAPDGSDGYVATLDPRTGQLRSLQLGCGLREELRVGGDGTDGSDGHGEIPGLDWGAGGDYLSAGGHTAEQRRPGRQAVGNVSKFRATNWGAAPNWAIEVGPVCCVVRRWGFPHHGVHPLFTPARFHIETSYTFWAGLPYFSKDGQISFPRLESQEPFELYYARDDEFVFSTFGAFDTCLWGRPTRDGPADGDSRAAAGPGGSSSGAGCEIVMAPPAAPDGHNDHGDGNLDTTAVGFVHSGRVSIVGIADPNCSTQQQ
eukprot:SAG22_NODE_1028_length_5942_cov_3.188088_3_plen_317_part_00